MLHDIDECSKSGNLKGVPGICQYLEEGLLNSADVVVLGSIKCETTHGRVECMDNAEMLLRRPRYEITTPLLSRNELIDNGSLALSAHIFRLSSSTDPVVYASKHPRPRLGQMWVERQYFLYQSTSD